MRHYSKCKKLPKFWLTNYLIVGAICAICETKKKQEEFHGISVENANIPATFALLVFRGQTFSTA